MLIFTPTLIDDEQLYDSDVDPRALKQHDTSSGPNCEPVVHRKRHDHEPRQTPCYGFKDH